MGVKSGSANRLPTVSSGRLQLINEERVQDIGALRNQLADLVRLHPPIDWSPTLLMAVNGVLNAGIIAQGLKDGGNLSGRSSTRLRLVT
jgi:hypothetical protein